MREIKFRAWDMVRKEFTSDIAILADGRVMSLEYQGYWAVNQSLILVQYTGLKDKEGNEIYEGDIVKVNIYSDEELQILPVYFDNGMFLIDIVTLGWFTGSIEIIGNIYEHSHLLNK